MHSSYYILIIAVLVILYILRRNQKAAILKRNVKKKKLEDKTEMIELAKRFIDKECLISAFDSNHQFDGIIKEVSNNAILIEKDGRLEAINLDFVIRIREYPRNKKGSKKNLVLG